MNDLLCLFYQSEDFCPCKRRQSLLITNQVHQKSCTSINANSKLTKDNSFSKSKPSESTGQNVCIAKENTKSIDQSKDSWDYRQQEKSMIRKPSKLVII